jgi:hypothetical protein
MNNLVDLFYSNMFLIIVVSVALAMLTTTLLRIIFKVYFGISAIPLTFFFILIFLFGPLPSIAQKSLIRDLVFLKRNNVQSNSMSNTIILLCENSTFSKNLNGYQYKWIKERYEIDVNNHLEANKLLTQSLDQTIINNDPLFTQGKNICDAAWMYNNYKLEHKEVDKDSIKVQDHMYTNAL